MTQRIFPRTLSCPDCSAEGITPALLVPRAELMSNVCPTVTAEPQRLNAEFQRLLIGQVTREIVLPPYRRKKEEMCDFVQAFPF